MIAHAASARSKEGQVPMSVAPFESECSAAKTGLEYAQNILLFSVAIEWSKE